MKSVTLMAVLFLFFTVGCNQRVEETGNLTQQSTPNPAASTPTPDELAAARGNFKKNCEPCHGEAGEGGLVKIDDKRLKVPSFKSEHALKHTDEQFVKQITNGGDGMPKFKDKLSPTEMNDLVRFIRHQFQGK
ncbi:MAG TPA: cytochrome c [Pyrinomonadaceae bacterium]|nr:cytochrome c [Pyrinomonadaceae bacterium]